MNEDKIYLNIRDNEGGEYKLNIFDDPPLLVARILYNELDEVGYLKCVFDEKDGELLLGDLWIENEVVHTPENLWFMAWRILFKPKPVNYRQKGLGTQLLKLAIDSARGRGYKRIYGSLTQEDVDSTPGLTNWYRKHGFQVCKPTDKSVEGAIASIHLDLA